MRENRNIATRIFLPLLIGLGLNVALVSSAWAQESKQEAKAGAIPDAVFGAMVGERIQATDSEGVVTTGKLKSATADSLIVVRDDGQISMLKKAGIVDFRAATAGASVAGAASTPTPPPECAELPSLLEQVSAADSKMVAAQLVCNAASSAGASQAMSLLGGFIPGGSLVQSAAEKGLQHGLKAGCESIAEAGLYKDLLTRYDALNQKCNGPGAKTYVSKGLPKGGGASTHAGPLPASYEKLIEAAQKNDIEKATAALDQVAEESTTNQHWCMNSYRSYRRRQALPDFRSPFEVAFEKSDEAMLKLLSARDCVTWAFPESAFYRAVEKGQDQIIPTLLDLQDDGGFGRAGPFGLSSSEEHRGVRFDLLLKRKGISADTPLMRRMALAEQTSNTSFLSVTAGLTSYGSEMLPTIGLRVFGWRRGNFAISAGELWHAPMSDKKFTLWGFSLVTVGPRFSLAENGRHQLGFHFHVAGFQLGWEKDHHLDFRDRPEDLNILGFVPTDIMYRYNGDGLGLSLGIRFPLISMCGDAKRDDTDCSFLRAFGEWTTFLAQLHWL